MDEKSPKSKRQVDEPRDSDSTAFDMWLDRGLHRMFDEVAQEPIPEELLKLIDFDRKN